MKTKLLHLLLFIALLPLTALTQNNKVIDRDSFSVQYPYNWAIDTEDEDYDPDALFSLDAPDDDGTIMFMLFDTPIDADEMIDEQEKAMKKALIKKPTSIEKIDSWGKYKGKGVIIKGKLMGVFNGYVKVFVHTTDTRSFFVMEQFYDKSTEKLANQINTIVTSFTLR